MYCLLVMVAGVLVTMVPWFSAAWILPLMCGYQSCQLGSYAVSDAAMLERVPGDVRGRVVGLFLTIAGTFSAMSPFALGYWIDLLKGRAAEQHAYVPLFATLGVMVAASSLATPLIAKLGPVQGPRIEPLSEVMPGTVGVTG
jgi:MFS family permease